MMKRHLLPLSVLLLLTACSSPEHKAERQVRDFLEAHVQVPEGKSLSVIGFSRMDSTSVLSHAAVNSLLRGLAAQKQFGPLPDGMLTPKDTTRKAGTLYFTRVKYEIIGKSDTARYQNTFYFNSEKTEIIAIK